jgi:exopolysaccharide biosynthesis polyprenyl glycosylphosphotransferase
MIQHRKRGLVVIHGLLLIMAQQSLFLFFLLAEQSSWSGLVAGSSDLTFTFYFLAMLLSGFAGFWFLSEFAHHLPHFGLFDSISLANRQAVALGISFVMVAFLVKDQETNRFFLLGLVGVDWLLLFLLNYYVPPVLGRWIFGGAHALPTILVGSEATALKLREWIERADSIGFKFHGLVTYEEAGNTPSVWGVPVIGEISRLKEILESRAISQVIILDTLSSKKWIDHLVDASASLGCRVLIYNNWQQLFDRPLSIVREGEHTFFSFQEEPLENPLNRCLKRLLDLGISIPVCLLVIPALSALFWLAQRFQSPGPLLYSQTRCGRLGKPFRIFKFRSMHVNGRANSDEATQAVRGDSRVFPMGAWMRRFSLDEIPQFFNVLRGEMSVVGPRPHLVQHDQMFAAEAPFYRTRFFVKPGITGLAQVKGFRGEILNPEVLHARVRWDLAYIRGWSIWLDLLIVLRTVRHMLFPPKSAY